MTRISSATYVATVLHFLQAYNAGDIDACEQFLDPEVDWHGVTMLTGRRDVRDMLEELRSRFSRPQVRPEDFRESDGHVLMVVGFHEGDPDAPRAELRQTWLVDLNDEGLITNVVSYAKAADAARALAALAPKVHA